MITVNGTQAEGAGMTAEALVRAQGFDPAQVAVERNEAIIPKSELSHTMIDDGDRVEIVRFVGGG